MNATHLPTGPWTGFFNYSAGGFQHRMDMVLSFENGRISGEGRDSVGPFVIAGGYDAESRECWWLKSYIGAHDVAYRGFAEGKGVWGTWEIPGDVRGGFHVWPIENDSSEEMFHFEREGASA